MEDHENEEATTIAAAAATRIFVGGLGENVKEEDMEQIFRASLGKVKAIDFIRTKGRSFAYLDFLPSSPKSLPKLFSTYNGCVWKGERLKLEKAKEHYLVRLKREWEEDAELGRCAPITGVDADKTIAAATLQSSNKVLKSDKTQLQIFFPKLQKVKSLPFCGTGKHKYSFQRVEVPPLPIHFCDCEEHYVPPHTAKENRFRRDPEEESGGINEEELNLMKSVMNKLFERDNNSKAASSNGELVEDGDGSGNSIIDPLLNDNEATDEEDEDNNLIINMVSRGDKIMDLSGCPEKVTMENQFDTQGSKFKQLQVSKGEPIRDMLKVHERKVVLSDKKRKNLNSKEYDRTESVSSIPKRQGGLQTLAHDADILLEPPRIELGYHQSTSPSWSQRSSWKQLVGDKRNNVFSISQVLPGGASRKEEQERSSDQDIPDSVDSKNQDLSDHGNIGGQSDQSKELEEFAEGQPSNAVNRSARGAAWLHKSSWIQLVSGTNNNSFSISQILPGIASEKTELPRSNSLDVASFKDNKHCNLVKQDKNDTTGDSSRIVGLGEGLLTAPSSSNTIASDNDKKFNALNGEQNNAEKNMEDVRSSNNFFAPSPVKIDHSAPKRASIGDMGIAGTCSFMRSAASVKEWANTKAVLSKSAKRKFNEK